MLKSQPIVDSQVIQLCDFGLATKTDAKEYLYKRCGTPGYVAPEIVRGDSHSPNFSTSTKCDTFSIGVTLFLLLSKLFIISAGETPFVGDNYKEILKRTSECRVNFNHKFLKNKSPALISLLKGLLAPNPAARYSAKEAIKHPVFSDLRKNEKGYKIGLIKVDSDCSDSSEEG